MKHYSFLKIGRGIVGSKDNWGPSKEFNDLSHAIKSIDRNTTIVSLLSYIAHLIRAQHELSLKNRLDDREIVEQHNKSLYQIINNEIKKQEKTRGPCPKTLKRYIRKHTYWDYHAHIYLRADNIDTIVGWIMSARHNRIFLSYPTNAKTKSYKQYKEWIKNKPKKQRVKP